MAGPVPIVRQFFVCEAVVFRPGVGYWVLNPRVDLQTPAGEVFPIAFPELFVFAQLSGSYGRQRFRLRVSDVTDPVNPTLVFETPERSIDLGQPLGGHRLRARNWAVRLSNVLFQQPGRYEFSMVFDGIIRARTELLVESGS